ncbi:MAG: hypothetical protein F6K19_08250 [Cyanothece sp. SIO1E1]|nr:hypothetical protein [Cyanothece sp. SIO1E1]
MSMKKLGYLTLFTLMMHAAGGLKAASSSAVIPVVASRTTAPIANDLPEQSPTAPLQLAQAQASNCRVSNRIIDVYSAPSVAADSQRLAILEPSTEIYLEGADDGTWVGANGFLRGSVPSAEVSGYVIARHLTKTADCGSNGGSASQSPTTQEPVAQQPTVSEPGTQAPTAEKFCARVTFPEGLAVLSKPQEGASIVDGVAFRQEVEITDEAKEAATGRTWVAIAQDKWIAETGRQGSGRNLSERFACQ